MEVLNLTVLTLIFCLAPALVLKCCDKAAWLGKIGPVLILYIIGIIIGNTGLMSAQMPKIQEILSNATIPLAIPLMLFGCRFRRSETRSQFLALATGIAAVIITVIAGYFIFGKHLDQGALVGGMLTGVYTGGTINLAALKAMLGVSDETYILINSYDMIVSFLYLTFLLSIGIKLFRKLLPYSPDGKRHGTGDAVLSDTGQDAASGMQNAGFTAPYRGLFTRSGMRSAGILLGITLIVCALSGGIALALPDSMFMAVFILMLTTFGIICSFIKPVREMKYGYDIGMYLIYIFCITVASMADLSSLDITGGIYLLAYLAFCVFGSLVLQALMARIFRIDADTMVISSVSFINSPPFVPMIAGAMGNKNVLAAGLSIGVVGYAVGNYLGFIIAGILGAL